MSEYKVSKGYRDFRKYVNAGLVTLCELSSEPYKVIRAQDGALIDEEGKRLHDFLAGWGTQGLGHLNSAVRQALRDYLDTEIPAFFTSAVSPMAGLLAAKLCERTKHYDHCWFASGGSEVVEAALKLARAATKRTRILSLRGAYHGCTMGSLALMEPGPFKDAFGPHLPEVQALPWGCIDSLKAALSNKDVAAIFVESVQIEGGVRWLTSEYVEALGRLTDEMGTVLVADEIQTGFGRMGYFLHSETWPRRPDIVVMGKTLGGGYMPLSAMVTKSELFARAYSHPLDVESHNSTFSGNSLACVAGMAALDLLTDELLEGARDKGAFFLDCLKREIGDHEFVKEIRSEGLLFGIELVNPEHPYYSFEYLGLEDMKAVSALGFLLTHRLFKDGYLVNVCGHRWDVLRIHPALDVTREQLEDFARCCRRQLDHLLSLT
ncbi:MAG: aspartate aminotransferase family protein [Planctomycetota bacterium]|nr:aspartate aminotransferase family protein [Planctomycetota bacterium]